MEFHPAFLEYFMRAMADYPPPSDTPLTAQESRALHQRLAAKIGPVRPMQTRDFTIPAAHPVPARLYTPDAKGPLPLFLFIHGGGWIGGDLDTHEVLCREIAHGAQCAVVAIDYRLAPENKFPAPLEDAVAASQFCLQHASDLGADPKRVAIGGDSAGGNLAAATMIALRDSGAPMPVLQVLIYPATDFRMVTSAYTTFAGPGLGPREFVWCREHYLNHEDEKLDPRASPILADLRGLPPAFVTTAENDVLCDDGEAYALALVKAGVPVQLRRYLGHPHGFLSLPLEVAPTVAGIADVCAGLRHAFSA
ncbi:MAG: alpha/beta hydrolase [Terricaulis sp.]